MITDGVQVRGLRVDLSASGAPIISDIAMSIAPGEVLGLVGESGSGKSTLSMALLGYAKNGTRIAKGEVYIDGRDLLQLPPRELRAARGHLVAYVPQDPSVSLNPALPIGIQLTEGLRHGRNPMGSHEALERVSTLLDAVQLPSTVEFLSRYPSQLSGGQQQRVVIAMAAAGRPRLIVLDEPTTGLDVTTQAEVLQMVGRLCSEYRIAAVYVSHDLGLISHVAHQILVLYSGRIVEHGQRDQVFGNPTHPYTVALLDALPSAQARRALKSIPGHAPIAVSRPTGCVFAPRCEFVIPRCTVAEPALIETDQQSVRCIRPGVATSAPSASIVPPEGRRELAPIMSVRNLSAAYASKTILHDISLEVRPGECVALVGESGSGKSTMSRCLIGLHEQRTGEILLGPDGLARAARDRTAEQRRRMQYIFQNPYGSLQPRRTIGSSLEVPLAYFFGINGAGARRRVGAALDRVGLQPALADRYPSELSGGERQRAAIARALVCNPDLLICDEVTSALDVSVQASVVELLRTLMKDGLGMLFITHNLAVVRSLADTVAVLSHGRLVEYSAASQLFEQPQAEYTRQLLENTLDVDRSGSLAMTVNA